MKPSERKLSSKKEQIMSTLKLSLLVVGLGLTACQTTSFEKPTPDFDYGTAPEVSGESVKSYMEGSLKDAESARYRFDAPVKAYCNKGVLSGGKVVWSGWVVPLTINAKNSYGGYAGFEPYYARYENGELIDVSPKQTLTWDFVPELGIGCRIEQQ